MAARRVTQAARCSSLGSSGFDRSWVTDLVEPTGHPVKHRNELLPLRGRKLAGYRPLDGAGLGVGSSQGLAACLGE